MNILEELWHGNINPQACVSPKDPRMEQALYLAEKNEDKMQAMLSEEQKEQFEKLCDAHKELTDLLERRAFTKGFRLAARMMAEVMNTSDNLPLEI